MPMLIAHELAGSSMVAPTLQSGQVLAEIIKHGIQALVIDPFVTTHQVNENDNVMIDGVMRVLRDIADSTSCAVEVAHHLRKLNGDEPTVDSVRGASSIIGAARSARIVSGMSKDDAAKCCIADDQRGYYSWLQNGKANMLAPTHKRRWLRMESVSLGNGRPPYEADEIGVVTPWDPPQLEVSLSGAELRMIRTAVLNADPVKHLRADIRSTGWIGYLIASVLQLEPKDPSVKSQMQLVIEKLMSDACLRRDQRYDPTKGRPAPVLMWETEDKEKAQPGH